MLVRLIDPVHMGTKYRMIGHEVLNRCANVRTCRWFLVQPLVLQDGQPLRVGAYDPAALMCSVRCFLPKSAASVAEALHIVREIATQAGGHSFPCNGQGILSCVALPECRFAPRQNGVSVVRRTCCPPQLWLHVASDEGCRRRQQRLESPGGYQ